MSPPPENGHRDEVVVPDDVSDPGGPVRPARRDRKPLIACVAGLTACWFAVFGPILVVVLAPTAMVIGRRVLRRVERSGGTNAERKQAKIGFWAGIVAVILLVLQLIIFQLFFEWEKDAPAVGDKAASSQPAG
ncbi:MAG TPA: hypothetical protein VID94_12610 [Acidimicrobiales bacterium]